MRTFIVLLLMSIGGTITVYTPLKDVYPPRHTVFLFMADKLPEITHYIPSFLLVPPEPAAEHDDNAEAMSIDATPEPNGEVIPESGPIETIWTEFKIDELEKLLGELGYQTERTVAELGAPMIMARRPDGLSFGLVLQACDPLRDPSPCYALEIISVIFTQLENNTMDERVITSMNDRHAFLKFVKSSDGQLEISRYMTADFGIARRNVAANIRAFVEILDLYMGKV